MSEGRTDCRRRTERLQRPTKTSTLNVRICIMPIRTGAMKFFGQQEELRRWVEIFKAVYVGDKMPRTLRKSCNAKR